ncbi:MAG: DUF502 domain-containing protein [Candidatus Tectomicrobia bacterium]|uniref:DUF502 domain-containing protein n=1 Tax=Tectimicrobiota bacterium TaxID=2528274 RepID=A0A932M1G2_UNCTE|nr:DUF502 domain-containing protein [Candidatus Tectomicrobia bacterium]
MKVKLGGIKTKIITGLVIVVPLWATYLVLRAFFETLDGLLGPYLKPLVQSLLPNIENIPGLGILAALLVLYLIGLVTANIIGRRFVHRMDALMKRIPLVKTIYSATKQITEALATPAKTAFKKVVLVELPYPGTYVLAFITNSIRDEQGRELPVVFVPCSPNPTTGFTLVMPPEKVIESNMTVEEGMKVILSMGIIFPGISALQAIPRDRPVAGVKP